MRRCCLSSRRYVTVLERGVSARLHLPRSSGRRVATPRRSRHWSGGARRRHEVTTRGVLQKACFQRRAALVLPDLKRNQASTRYLTRPACPCGGAPLDDVAVLGRSSMIFVFSVSREEIPSSMGAEFYAVDV